MLKLRPILLVCVAITAIGCAEKPSATLRPSSEEARTRDERQNITLQDVDSATGEPIEGQVEELPVFEFDKLIGEHCDLVRTYGTRVVETDAGQDFETNGRNGQCGLQLAEAERALCAANTLLEITESPKPVRVDYYSDAYPAGRRVLVLPPTVESKAALAATAYQKAWDMAVAIGRALSSATWEGSYAGGFGGCQAERIVAALLDFEGNPVLSESGESVTVADAMVERLIEGTLIAREATAAFVESSLAVADAEASRSSDGLSGAALAWAGREMSRYAAARMLVGRELSTESAELKRAYGDLVGLGGAPDEAMRFIRSSVGDASALLDRDISDRVVIEGTSPNDPNALRQRYAERTGKPELALLTANELLQRIGVSPGEFATARKWIVAERVLFGRVPGKSFDPTGADLAVRRPPTMASPAYRNTMVRYGEAFTVFGERARGDGVVYRGDSSGNYYPKWPIEPVLGVLGRSKFVNSEVASEWSSLAELLDYVGSVAYSVLQESARGTFPDSATSDPVQLPEGALDRLGFLLSTVVSEREARVEICQSAGVAANTFTFRVMGSHAANGLHVVRGVAGLQCATSGAVEGVACDLSDYIVASSSVSTPIEVNHVAGFPEYWEMQVAISSATPGDYLYVVQRQEGRSDTAGNYDALTGVPLELRSSISNVKNCVVNAIFPELESQAANILTPAASNLSRPAHSCADVGYNAPIPLENELTDDGNGVESSWRHYLALAKEAAAHADQLGKDLIDSGLNIDDRIELAEADVEEVCGGAVSLRDSFWSRAQNATVGACGATTDCPAGYECLASTCVMNIEAMLDPVEDERLLECIGNDTIVPLVALGSNELCVWHRADVTGEGTGATADASVCEALVDGNGDALTLSVPCPFAPERDGSCSRPEGLPATHAVSKTFHTLNLFEAIARSEVEAFEPPSSEFDCDLVRDLWRDPKAWPTLARSGRLNFEWINGLAERIAWEEYPEAYGSITIDGNIQWSLGYPFRKTGDEPHYYGESPTKWPCFSPNLSAMDALEVNQSSILYDHPRAYCEFSDASAQPEHRGSLFSSYTCGCGSTDTEGYRRRDAMKYRVRDAVLALRTLAGVGYRGLTLGEGFYDLAPEFDWDEDTAGVEYLFGARVVERREHSGDVGASYPCEGCGGRTVGRGGVKVARESYRPTDDSLLFIGSLGVLAPNILLLEILEPAWLDPSSAVDKLALAKQRWSRLASAGFSNPIVEAASLVSDDPGAAVFKENDLPKAIGGVQVAPLRRYAYLTARSIVDALELACEADRVGDFSGGCREAASLVAHRPEDLGVAAQALECMANQILVNSARTVVRNVPTAVLEPEAVRTAFEGERGRAVSSLASSYIMLGGYQSRIESVLRSMSSDVARLRRLLKQNSLSRESAKLQQLAQTLNQATSCVASIGNAVSATNWGGGAAAAATCANAAAQIAIGYKQLDITNEQLDLAEGQSWGDFQDDFQGHADVLDEVARNLNAELTNITGHTASVETQRQKARRKLANALMFSEDTQGRKSAVNNVLHARYNTALIRYKQAYRHALKVADLARRALEQRIGMRLSEMNENLTLVERPSKWVDTLCTMTGVDYQRIADGDLPDGNYATEYVGDYVRKLEQTFESYSLDYNFTDGTDTAVVSLRDDVALTRAACFAESTNLLGDSANLAGSYWQVEGCPSGVPHCVARRERVQTSDDDEALWPAIYDWYGERGVIKPVRVSFGPDSGEGFTSANGKVALAQRVELGAGVYRLSWRALTGTRDAHTAFTAEQIAADEQDPSLENFIELDHYRADSLEQNIGWDVHYMFFEVPEGGAPVRIALRPEGTGLDQNLEVAGVMLESVRTSLLSARLNLAEDAPPAFSVTTDPAVKHSLLCEDTTGEQFRATGWQKRCEELCPAGIGTCDSGEEQCFWERDFYIDLRDLETRTVLSKAGFALGNYNYRIENLGVNFVGTGLRRCDDGSSGCYSNGTVQYSIHHEAPYEVRNHRGEVFEAELFPGRIEHARGLAAERYLTNPLSSADRALMGDYFRRELAGRPLTGRFLLRVWDDGNVAFENLEDIQVVLGYRYWTRNQ